MLEQRTIYQGETPMWLVGHDTDGNGTMANLSSGYTCQIKVLGTAIDRAVTFLSADNFYFMASLTAAETAALAQGSYIVAVKIAKAADNFNNEAQGILVVEGSAFVAPYEGEPANALAVLRQDRADVWAAMIGAAKGERIKEVWRDGRRVVNDTWSYQQCKDMLAMIDAEIARQEEALGATPSRPRRGAIGIRYA